MMGTAVLFKNGTEVPVLRNFFLKSIRYFQFFVITYQSKIKSSLLELSSLQENLKAHDASDESSGINGSEYSDEVFDL